MNEKTRFSLKEMPAGMWSERRIYPKVTGGATMQPEAVVAHIAHSTTLTAADVRATLTALHDLLVEQLACGNRVCLEGIGIFNATLTLNAKGADKLKQGRKIIGSDVALKRIWCRTAPLLRRHVEASLSPTPQPKSRAGGDETVDTMEARLDKALAFIGERGALYLNDYVGLTHLSRTTAWRELNRLVSLGRLQKEGSGARTHYVAG
ncbi:MAG: HU family DNA-binding protein [Alloprevotella sp.]|nr:HU family DNA-binding protein [Alloprevotella sp.]